MFIEQKEGESFNETCMRCIETYQKNTYGAVFDYSRCSHCVLSQAIHEEDSRVWNGSGLSHFIR